jgi:ubiquinone/menaquinone biosynthesis C-methylase UbiE
MKLWFKINVSKKIKTTFGELGLKNVQSRGFMHQKKTSWENVEEWYSSCVGEKGHYYHQTVIVPGILPWLEGVQSILDLGCGPAILARALPSMTAYYGVDASPSLIRQAEKLTKGFNARFSVADVTQTLPVEKKDFDAVSFILSLQNMERPDQAIQQARRHLRTKGRLLIVLNHPCFRIPRQSSWGIDEINKVQYRRINRYHTPLKIPIQARPGRDKDDTITWSYHHSLGDYMRFLSDNQFVLMQMQEWYSNKESYGAKSRMENRARQEIPLFLALLAHYF